MGGIIDVTPKMVEAGLMRVFEFRFGDDLAEVIRAVYLAMELEKRSDARLRLSDQVAKEV